MKKLELQLDRLRSLYDQYFRGIERTPPNTLRKDVENRIRALSKIRMKNTALRFKLQVQIQKYTTHLAMWQRMLRDLEEGKIKRGKGEEEPGGAPSNVIIAARMEKRAERERQGKTEDFSNIDIDIDIDIDFD
ncbi:MAG: hypothetical protein ABIJ56_10640 [Pseudomonadota bacterium]